MFSQSERHPAIIVIDDEPDIALILHRLMRDLVSGYDVITANNGAEVLAQLELRPVPLVITDLNMPGMNGLQLTAAIKERSPITRVTLITAFATNDLHRKARAYGIDDFLPKPFSLETLEQIVHSVLSSYERREVRYTT